MSEETGDKDDAFPISEAVFREILKHSVEAKSPLSEAALRQIAHAAGYVPDEVVEYHNQERDIIREENEDRLAADDAMPASFSRVPFVRPTR